LNYWNDGAFINSLTENSKTIQAGLNAIAAENAERNWTVRGRGMVWGLDVGCGEFASLVSKTAFRRGLIIETCGAHDQVLKLLPPLTISPEELAFGLRIMAESIEEVLRLSETRESSRALPLSVLSNDVANSSSIFATI